MLPEFKLCDSVHIRNHCARWFIQQCYYTENTFYRHLGNDIASFQYKVFFGLYFETNFSAFINNIAEIIVKYAIENITSISSVLNRYHLPLQIMNYK